MPTPSRRSRAVIALLALLGLVLVGCGGPTATATAPGAAPDPNRTLKLSAVPDQDPDKLVTINGAMAAHLTTALGVKVEFVPVTDYAASVSLFRTGDLDVVFFGGLTGVQARLQTPGAVLLAQRDVDAAFQSVFIASTSSGIQPVSEVQQLRALQGRRFTFGSESSTSGRLMPEYFLDQAGLSSETDLAGPPGYSGSHDKTVELVQSGTYEAGALNLQVWTSRKEKGTVDLTKVTEVFTTPAYHDYHWLAGPKTDERFGSGFTERIAAALTALDGSDPAHAALLGLYGAGKLVPTTEANYREIEEIGRKRKLIS